MTIRRQPWGPVVQGSLARPDAAVSRLVHEADLAGSKPYQYRGQQRWDPGAVEGGLRAQPLEVQARLRELRDEAARRCGLERYTRRLHDRIRAVEAAEQSRPWPGRPIMGDIPIVR